jgi:hypothetical protein
MRIFLASDLKSFKSFAESNETETEFYNSKIKNLESFEINDIFHKI